MSSVYRIIFCITAVLPSFFLTACRSVPISDRTQLMLSSQSSENRLGADAYAEYKQKYRQSASTEYNHALARCGTAIRDVSGENDFQWEFIVFEDATQNAFCLPGGKVAVYSGLIRTMKNEAELACVVAHEVAHALARHAGERISWSMLQSIGGLAVSIGFNNETINSIYGTGTQLGVMLPFSRSNEYEADRIGLILMARAGYDPNAAVHFWERFSQGKTASWTGTITSTHPCDADRIANFRKNLPQAEEEYRNASAKKGFGTVFTHRR